MLEMIWRETGAQVTSKGRSVSFCPAASRRRTWSISFCPVRNLRGMYAISSGRAVSIEGRASELKNLSQNEYTMMRGGEIAQMIQIRHFCDRSGSPPARSPDWRGSFLSSP
jgi:hypothetical protein